jgi:hypothetical protein
VFHTHISSVSAVSYVCCKCFIWMFQSGFSVATSVSDVWFMCFICLQTYVASVTSRCFKSRLSVVSLSSLFCCLIFASLSPPPLGVDWASAAPSPGPLIDAGLATCCSHLLQLLTMCMHVTKWRRHERGLPTWARKYRCGGRVQAQASVRTSER